MTQGHTGGGWCWEREETVQYADLDTNDHVNNVVFLRWMQEARVAYLRIKLLPQLIAQGEHLSLVVGESSVTYLRPAFYPERVLLRMAVSSVGTSSFNLSYEIVKKVLETDEDLLCATGSVRMVCVDPKTQSKAAITPLLRSLLQSEMISSERSGNTNSEKRQSAPTDIRKWPVCWTHKVEFRDLDPNLHANNIAVVYWMQEARVKWLDEVRRELAKITTDEDFDAVTAAVTIQYLSPMKYEEEARVYVRMLQLGTTSVSIEHLVVRPNKGDEDKNEVCYRCTARLVAYDHDKQAKVAISPAIKLALDRVERRQHARL